MTGNKTDPAYIHDISFQVKVGGNLAMNSKLVQYWYGLVWSDEATWGGDFKPVVQDLVYVPPGQTLIVDESTPKPLKMILNEGKLIFADNTDLTIDAEFIISRGGQVQIGREGFPYQHKLTITLWGNFFTDQLPEFGNKVLGCHHCTLDIHGQPKVPTWTFLQNTVAVGANSLTVT